MTINFSFPRIIRMSADFFFFALLSISGALFSAPSENELQRAESLFRKGNMLSASLLFSDILKENPGHPAASYYLGRLSESGDSAALFFETALSGEIDPNRKGEMLEYLGHYAWIKGDSAKSASYFTAASVILENPEKKANVLLALARVRMETGEIARAESIFSTLVSENRTGVREAQIGLADCSFENASPETALHRYQAIADSNDSPDKSHVYGRIIRCLVQMGRMERAKGVAGKLRLEFPDGLEWKALQQEIPALDSIFNMAGPSAAANEFWIQVGAFSNQKNADLFKNKLEKQLVSSDSQFIQIHKTEKLFLVRIGLFQSEEIATQWASANVIRLNLPFRITKFSQNSSPSTKK